MAGKDPGSEASKRMHEYLLAQQRRKEQYQLRKYGEVTQPPQPSITRPACAIAQLSTEVDVSLPPIQQHLSAHHGQAPMCDARKSGANGLTSSVARVHAQELGRRATHAPRFGSMVLGMHGQHQPAGTFLPPISNQRRPSLRPHTLSSPLLAAASTSKAPAASQSTCSETSAGGECMRDVMGHQTSRTFMLAM